jgi:methionyl-tRNA synthetase
LVAQLYIFYSDWSHEQLDKYKHEIQAYVGNSLLRITSDRIMARVQGAKPRTLAEIYKDKESPNHQVIAAHLRLAENVERCLREMEVAEALQHIVDLLKLVRLCISVYRRLTHILS